MKRMHNNFSLKIRRVKQPWELPLILGAHLALSRNINMHVLQIKFQLHFSWLLLSSDVPQIFQFLL